MRKTEEILRSLLHQKGAEDDPFRAAGGNHRDDLPDHRLHRGGIQYHQVDGVQQSRRNQHHEIRRSDQLVYSRAVPGRGHYYRNHICRHIRRDIGTAVSEDHRCDRSTGIFGVINADGTGRLPDL